jgi:C-terminal processing protease CtpA/Prc
VTTAEYFTPKRRSIHGQGITPTSSWRRRRWWQPPGAEQPVPTPPVSETPQEQLKRDPQLQRALDLLKAMKILDKGRPGPAGPQAQTR